LLIKNITKMKNFAFYKRLMRYDILASTNDFAVELISSDKPAEGTVIMADFQTEGKGQKNAVWISEKGSNLTFSIILYPSFLYPANNFYLSMAISLGIVDMMMFFGIDARIKWPNDICTNNGKIAGILIENAIQNNELKYSVIGIGLNVNQEIFPEEIPNPTSMKIELNTINDREIILKKLLQSTENWLLKLYDMNFNLIKERYEQQLLFKNQLKKFCAGEDIFSGTIIGINDTGQLLIADESDTIRTFSFKEVMYCN
jgi:BirA family biotin operon repressor/biotin-[acetyl-CoA-carboxylase] ligase